MFVTQKSVNRNFFNHCSCYEHVAWLNVFNELKMKIQQIRAGIAQSV
jgi:hypothetical protein